MKNDKKQTRGGKKPGSLGRILRLLIEFYPRLVPLTAVCIIFSAIVSSIPSVFVQKVLSIVTDYLERGDSDIGAAFAEIIPIMIILIVLYLLAMLSITAYNQLMAVITQGFLCKLRCRMFDGMQNLPISYFDTHKHGDIMSYYTNDIDALRQLVSQSLPQLLQAAVIVLTVLGIMLWCSIPMTLIIVIGVVLMVIVSKKVGSGSAKYFIRQQRSIGSAEGYAQEMMNGQKVIKVFCMRRRRSEALRR